MDGAAPEPVLGAPLPPENSTPDDLPPTFWYLGIDLGTTGISAALLNGRTGHRYPIRWSGVGQATVQRLAAIVYLAAESTATSLGDAAQDLLTTMAQGTLSTQMATPGVLLHHFKPYLGMGLPYLTAQQAWQPEVQWTDAQAVSLKSIRQGLTVLLQSFLASPASSGLTCTVEGLDRSTSEAILHQLTGVIVNCPVAWSDTYRFNLREAVLEAGLVNHPEQVYLLEDTIAALLAELPALGQGNPTYTVASNTRGQSLTGNTLIMSAGATTTELLLVNLPPDNQSFFRQDLYLRSFTYAGDAISQDLICQVLLPSAWGWEELNLQNLDLPLPGEPDSLARYRLQQRLRSSAFGLRLLAAVNQLKLALHQQSSASFELQTQQWNVTQQELHSRVILPYIQRLNREVNTLLTQSGTAMEGVRSVLCVGGTATMPAISYWLKQKLPNATILSHAGTSPLTCSPIALGLATLPLYAQVIDTIQHQYSEYFLLRELLRILPAEPLSLGRILQLLENQGINTHTCQRTILNLLEGHLPAGLVPDKVDLALFSAASRQNPDYQGMATPFSRQGNQVYEVKPDLRDRLQEYLSRVLASSYQSLEDPLTMNLPIRMG